jgi:hypothetical protein
MLFELVHRSCWNVNENGNEHRVSWSPNFSYPRRAPLWGTGTIVGYSDFWKNKLFYPAERLLSYNNDENNKCGALGQRQFCRFRGTKCPSFLPQIEGGYISWIKWWIQQQQFCQRDGKSRYQVSECANKLFCVPLTQFWHTDMPPSPTSFTWNKFGWKIRTSVSVIWLCRCISDRPVTS